MSLDTIAESIGTIRDEQKDDIDRVHTDDTAEELQARGMAEYDGGWAVDH